MLVFGLTSDIKVDTFVIQITGYENKPIQNSAERYYGATLDRSFFQGIKKGSSFILHFWR